MFERVKKFLGWFPEEEPKVLIWGVLDGPYNREDFPEEVLLEEGVLDNWQSVLLAKVEIDGKVGSANLWYGSFDEAYEVKKYFDTNIEPLELDFSSNIGN